VYAVLELTDDEIDYIKTNYPQIEVYVAVNPTYRDGLALDEDRVKMHGAKALHWENHDWMYTLGSESSDEGYFIYPVHPTFWWNVGSTCPVHVAQELVYNTHASPAVVFLHTPLTHDDYVSYSIQAVIGPGLENQCPVLEPIDDIAVKETELITIVANGMDVDNDSLTHYISDPRFDQDYNTFTWRPEEGDIDRSAMAQATIGLCVNGKEAHAFAGQVEGRIALAPRGKDGFGWDPIFIPKGEERTFGEMSQEEKNAVSHRRRAFEALKQFLATHDFPTKPFAGPTSS